MPPSWQILSFENSILSVFNTQLSWRQQRQRRYSYPTQASHLTGRLRPGDLTGGQRPDDRTIQRRSDLTGEQRPNNLTGRQRADDLTEGQNKSDLKGGERPGDLTKDGGQVIWEPMFWSLTSDCWWKKQSEVIHLQMEVTELQKTEARWFYRRTEEKRSDRST